MSKGKKPADPASPLILETPEPKLSLTLQPRRDAGGEKIKVLIRVRPKLASEFVKEEVATVNVKVSASKPLTDLQDAEIRLANFNHVVESRYSQVFPGATN